MKYFSFIKDAWKDYVYTRKINNIKDISIKVPTNHVYKIILIDGLKIFAKNLIQDSVNLYLPNFDKVVLSNKMRNYVLSWLKKLDL